MRAGESAEQVAASAGMALDRVLRFAYPVLQERSRVVAQARTAPVRPPAPEQLGDLVEERLVGRGTGADTLEWDAWRREDGRWAVRLSWRYGDSAHAANWSLDLGRRALQSEDPAAEQLSAKEFHARTITAVTPLAVAARAAAEPTSATRPAGSGRPDPGRTAHTTATARPVPFPTAPPSVTAPPAPFPTAPPSVTAPPAPFPTAPPSVTARPPAPTAPAPTPPGPSGPGPGGAAPSGPRAGRQHAASALTARGGGHPRLGTRTPRTTAIPARAGSRPAAGPPAGRRRE